MVFDYRELTLQFGLCFQTFPKPADGLAYRGIVQSACQLPQLSQTQAALFATQPKRRVPCPIAVLLDQLLPTLAFHLFQRTHNLRPTAPSNQMPECRLLASIACCLPT